MRTIKVEEVIDAVKKLCIESNYDLGQDVMEAFEKALIAEESEAGKSALKILIENARIAREEQAPMCQDTGFAVFFVELGQDLLIEGGLLVDAINEGVRRGYQEGYLRKSLCDPFTRTNTGDNTPAVIHIDLVAGDRMKIVAAPKGGGSENMSRVTMLSPSDGIEGIKKFIVQRASESGSNPCPPVIIGVGIGGTFEKAALLAKKALLRPLGSKNPDSQLAEMEEDLLRKINDLGMGPQGLGGRVFALGVHIEKFPCHIASLPLAVNINCHTSRHKEVIL